MLPNALTFVDIQTCNSNKTTQWNNLISYYCIFFYTKSCGTPRVKRLKLFPLEFSTYEM